MLFFKFIDIITFLLNLSKGKDYYLGNVGTRSMYLMWYSSTLSIIRLGSTKIRQIFSRIDLISSDAIHTIAATNSSPATINID